MKQDDLLKKLKEHQPIVVNYGKGYFSDKEIREPAYWDDEKNAYVSETGVWDTKLLVEIIQGRVEKTKLEE